MQMKNGGEAIQKKVDQVTNEVFILNASAEYRIKLLLYCFMQLNGRKLLPSRNPLKFILKERLKNDSQFRFFFFFFYFQVPLHNFISLSPLLSVPLKMGRALQNEKGGVFNN